MERNKLQNTAASVALDREKARQPREIKFKKKKKNYTGDGTEKRHSTKQKEKFSEKNDKVVCEKVWDRKKKKVSDQQ